MTTTMKIRYADESLRATWKTVADVLKTFSAEEVVEMCNRYQDTQRHAIAYRKRAQVKQAIMKERLAELEARLASGPAEDVDEDPEEA